VNRRELIVFVGATVWQLAVVVPVVAQQSVKMPRIGILTPAETDATPIFDAFRKGLLDLGYVEGKTIIFDFRFAKGNLEALPGLAEELVRIPVEVIVTDTTNATIAAAGATSTIPIVMAASGGDPIALGLASSIAHPGRNVTGLLFRSLELGPKRLELLRDAFPRAVRVSILFNPMSAIGLPGLRATEDAAKLLQRVPVIVDHSLHA
jgi:ABC-type uncharacterized transport system substrate-binding protein